MRSLTLLLIVCAATAAHPAPADDPLAAIRAACADDAQKLCAGVQPGGGRIVACLKEHKDSLSDRCKQTAGLPVSPGSGSEASLAAQRPSAAANAASAPAGAPAATAGSTGADGGSPDKPAPAHKATAPSKADKAAAEKFVERVITDSYHGDMRAATLHVPVKWHFEGKIEWHYDWSEYLVSYSSHAENPDNAEAFFQYPLLLLEFSELAPQFRQYDKSRKYRPGERMPSGALYSPPLPPVQTLVKFIQKTRPNAVNFKWLGQQDLPDLSKALHGKPAPNRHGLAIKVGYDLGGQPVEEAFFADYFLSQVTNQGMAAGMAKLTDWGLEDLQSFRAPAGTLEKRMPMFCVIAKSLYQNPQWGRLVKAINDKVVADMAQKLKQGEDQLRAAQAIMNQTMKDQAAFQANFDKQEAAFRSSGGVDDSYLRDGGKRSAADHWDDLIRGVDTLNDPNGGTTQLSNAGQYHFTDGFGNYRTSDDSNYTPEKSGEVGSWTQMAEAP
ncbi:MAG: cysteine rich repeat-containing protein [Pseudomonadota bacterium]|nr:cysteine rich repeat-containing protein [Pseudomonadota bacterium]